MSIDTVYAVYGTDVDRDYILGYATGDPKDIQEFYEHRGGYGLKLVKVEPIKITGETAEKIKKLRNIKTNAKEQVRLADLELKKLGIVE